MKDSQIKKLFQEHLTPILPDYRVKGKLIFRQPVEMLLMGFSLESSSYNRDMLYVTAFVQPLYVPVEHLTYVISKRLNTGYEMDASETQVKKIITDIQKRGLPFLSELDTVEKVAKNSARYADKSDYYLQEITAYSYLLLNEPLQATQKLNSLSKQLEKVIAKEPDVLWLQSLLERVKKIQIYSEENSKSTLAIINTWIEENKRTLKIE